jgi:probable phosphoglycerate mutase
MGGPFRIDARSLTVMARTLLHLMRHGEAGGHDDDDPGLTDVGRRQIAAAAMHVRALRPDAVLHSSRRRAVESAQIVGEALGLVPQYGPAADDLTPVPLDPADVPDRYRAFFRDVPPAERDLGGIRLDRAIADLGHVGDADRSLLVVTHAFVIGWFVRHAMDAPWWRWIGLQPANGSLTTIVFETDRAPRVEAFNERVHLPVE